MRQRKATKARPYPEHWTVSTEITVNGRRVTPGTEVSIRGERGRFLFVKHVKTPTAEWIDVVNGGDKGTGFRSFTPNRVRTVHRLTVMRANA
jgi:hypothetical protein